MCYKTPALSLVCTYQMWVCVCVCLHILSWDWALSQISLIILKNPTPSHISSILVPLETHRAHLPQTMGVSFSHWWESNTVPIYCNVMPGLECWLPRFILAWIWCLIYWNPRSSAHRREGLSQMENNLPSTWVGRVSNFNFGFPVLFKKLAANWFCQF